MPTVASAVPLNHLLPRPALELFKNLGNREPARAVRARVEVRVGPATVGIVTLGLGGFE